RTKELATLEQWIIQERCRLVTLLGMGGIGKTCLSVKLAEQIQHKFDFIIWRSLRYAPPVQDMLAEIIRYISNHQHTDLPITISGKISLLISYLKSARCLLILDNVETVLQPASCNYNAGYYNQGYEGYGELIRRIGENQHQSCLVLTSREKPQEIRLMQGEILPVRVWQLSGLQVAEAKQIFQAKGYFSASHEDWNRLIDFYAGNPLKLNIVATTIQKLFNGNVGEFLKHKTGVFGSIRLLVKQQFERLSYPEKNLLTWLAINSQPASILELQAQISPFISPQKLLEALESLQERSLIEKNTAFFSLQPLVIEYVTDQLRQDKINYRIKHDELSEIEFRQLNQTSQTKTHS
ncbi:MAG: NB-ARC domain-containing protein, partial [Nostocaceae cyanobacterium]|nr:NB-ARC domain-containing protein [Nostocaceae cyanobacterium]